MKKEVPIVIGITLVNEHFRIENNDVSASLNQPIIYFGLRTNTSSTIPYALASSAVIQ